MKTTLPKDLTFNKDDILIEVRTIEILEAQIANLECQIDELKIKYDTFVSFVLQSLSDTRFAEILNGITDYSEWFQMLRIATKRFLVILTVCDTPGNDMSIDIIKGIVDAGFTEFRNDLWYTYIGVIHKGKKYADFGKWNEEKCFYTYGSLDSEFQIFATSQSWRQGCSGDIRVNDMSLAINKRGVNIVVYDTVNKNLIDSIRFDSHEATKKIFEKM